MRRRLQKPARALELARAMMASAGRPQNNDALLFAIGQLHTRLLSTHAPSNLNQAEFKVFSQFGEDGIIQFLIRRARITHELFVEIGVQDYSESNTRFLLTNNNWHGVIIDSGDRHVRKARGLVGWQYSLDMVQSLVTVENINELLPSDPLGLLSIDVDGNDFWLWNAVDSAPQLVVVEYNSLFGPEALVSVPYDPNFSWLEAHPSGQYHGASLGALNYLANQKGYSLVGGTTEGVNAFFVRDDCLGSLTPVPVADAWRPSKFRPAPGNGRLAFADRDRNRLALIVSMPLVDVQTEEMTTVGIACEKS